MPIPRTLLRALHLGGVSTLLLLLAGCLDQLPLEPEEQRPLTPSGAVAANLNATPPGHVRIGIIPSSTSLSMGGTQGFSVIDKATGDVVMTGSGEHVRFDLESTAVTKIYYRLQVVCGRQSVVAEWKTRADAAGYPTYMDQHPTFGCWRLFIGEFPTNASWSTRAAFKNELIAKGLARSDAWWPTPFAVSEGVSAIRVTRGTEEVVLSSNIVVAPTGDGLVRIGNAVYRGRAEVTFNSGGTLAAVNEVPLEEYLYGVVPRELPPGPYGEPEAQKAQAIAARTYALANLGKRRGDGYDLLPTQFDQVYGGYGSEHPVSTAAVNATAGLVAVYNGRLISTLYHSTSGGYTANSEDVYANYVAYLRGVPDAERGAALEHVPTLEMFKRYPNPTNLRAAAEGDFEADWSRYHRWVVEWTAEEMAQALGTPESFNTDVGEVLAVEVVDRAEHGRVQEIHFHTSKAGVLKAYKDNIRTRLRYPLANNQFASLRSTLFFIEPVTDPKTKAVTGWKAYGGGWGHGVGMSQTGAVGMAKRGRSYQEILRHYYRGISVTGSS